MDDGDSVVTLQARSRIREEGQRGKGEGRQPLGQWGTGHTPVTQLARGVAPLSRAPKVRYAHTNGHTFTGALATGSSHAMSPPPSQYSAASTVHTRSVLARGGGRAG